MEDLEILDSEILDLEIIAAAAVTVRMEEEVEAEDVDV